MRPTTPPALAALLALALPALADDVNIYSSRHYDTDERLYSDFTDLTGIQVNRIEGQPEELIARMQAEGANSPADIFLTVDAGRIWLADQAGLLQPVSSPLLEERIPEHLRHPDGHWFGFSQRARIIFYARDRVPEPPETYAALADPEWKGRICIRSALSSYNLSLMAAMIANHGAEAARAWATGLLANLARPPQGADTDQLEGLVSGECDVAVVNTYYFARALAEPIDGVSEGIANIGWVFPDQAGTGTHVNVSAAGVATHAPHPDAAIAFLEYLSSDQAQQYFANRNYEFPTVPGVEVGAAAASLGSFRSDTLNLDRLGENQAEAQRIFNEIGFP